MEGHMDFIERFNIPDETVLTEKPRIDKTAMIADSWFGKYTEVMPFTQIIESRMDDYSYICEYGNVIYAEIGKFANIAAMCRINPGFHPMERPTLHHFTYRSARYGMHADDAEYFRWRRIQKVVIGNDTWIGHGTVIMPGVRIGNGSVVGSNSVVTRDVPPYCIVAGAPAKAIRRRFPKDISDALEKSSWWNWDYDTIRERMEDFKDIRKFLRKYC
jgi:phosphonate metabolism protein (transferase hexapeptide repeat family)